jgi:hypothetical protein
MEISHPRPAAKGSCGHKNEQKMIIFSIHNMKHSERGAEGSRTPDLRRAKAARYFAGPFRSLQNTCKSASGNSGAFPTLSEE